MSRAALSLLAGFAGLSALLTLLVRLDARYLTSPDSGYYLQSAARLLAGQGYVMASDGRLVWNSTFPIGYSALIAAVSGLTGLSVLAASKLVNVLAIGGMGWLWTRRLGANRASWLVSVWWLGQFVRIAAYTWSETVFLVLLAEWVWQLHQFAERPDVARGLRIWAVATALFLTRYVGGYVVGLMLLVALLNGRLPNRMRQTTGLSGNRAAATRLVVISFVTLAGMLAYFGINDRLSGSAFGGERFVSTEPAGPLAVLLIRSLLNESLLLRDLVPGQDTTLVWLGVGLQTVLVGVGLIRFWRVRPAAVNASRLSRLAGWTGVAYFLVLFALRVVSPFAGPNLRLMAPGTFCLLTAGLLWCSEQPTAVQRTLRPYWLAILIASGLQLLPQIDSSRKLRQVWEQVTATRSALSMSSDSQRINPFLHQNQ
ncbi:hypothetical protein DYU11_29975 [Fibrisoma montanum]|uniref:Glycosyltransferase RgtA/B/C/D-like domain-containing protein n=1 Tax=Fibrisoma montanum TaxID=2305895 RepID=A0A418LX57_9BACT|nr:hypothetical protein [Fibrisoma montanum]RIV17942.1 hypothetical protein DYU11_29975 [Fibrisoma montanum]